MNFQKRRRRRYPGPSGFAGVKRESIVVMMERFTSANALVEIDNLAPIIPSIDVADRTTNRAAEMGTDVAPVPIRQGF